MCSLPATVADFYRYVVGVDTHAATHSYAIVARTGALIDEASFPTNPAGLRRARLQFGPEFAIVVPLVLDTVISVLAVTVLLERALRRQTITIKGWRVTLRWPTWPLTALWIYFGGSVAGNVAHALPILPAQLVAAVPPISAALTFHLLLRLLDRAPALRGTSSKGNEPRDDGPGAPISRPGRRSGARPRSRLPAGLRRCRARVTTVGVRP